MENTILTKLATEELGNIVKKALKEVLPESYTNKKGRLLTRRETVAILRISLPTLNEWTKTGKVSAVRGNSRVRYYEADVYNALENYNKYERLP